MAEQAALTVASVLGKAALKYGRDHVKIDKRTYETRMMYEMIRTEIGQIKRYVEEVAARSHEMATTRKTLELLFIANQITGFDDPALVEKVEGLIAEPQWGPAKTALTDVHTNSENPIFQVKATGLLIMMYSLELLTSKLERAAFEQLIDNLLHSLFQENVKFKIDKDLFSTSYLPEKLKLKMADSTELRETVKEFLRTVIYCFTCKIEDPMSEEGNIEQLVEVLKRELPTGFKKQKLEGWQGVLRWLYDWEDIIELPTPEADFAPALFDLVKWKKQLIVLEGVVFGVVPRSFSREIGPDHEKRHKAGDTELIRPKPNSYQALNISYLSMRDPYHYDLRLERILHLPKIVGVTKDICPSPSLIDTWWRMRRINLTAEDRLIAWSEHLLYRLNIQTGVSKMLKIDPSVDYNTINAFAVENLDFVVHRVVTKEVPGVVITVTDENGEHKTIGRIDGVTPWVVGRLYSDVLYNDRTLGWDGLGRTYAWRDISGDFTIVFICDDGHIKIHAEGTLRDIEIPEINRPVAIVEHPSRFLVLDQNGAMFEITAVEDAETLGWTATEIGRMKKPKFVTSDQHIALARAIANYSEVVITIVWLIGGDHYDRSSHFVPLPPTIQRGSAP